MKPNHYLEKIQKLAERAGRARGTKDESAACRAVVDAQIERRLARPGSTGPTADALANAHHARAEAARELAFGELPPSQASIAKRIEREATLAFLMRKAEIRKAASSTPPPEKDGPVVKEIVSLLERAKAQDRVDAEITLDKVAELAIQLAAPPDGLSDLLEKARTVFAGEFSDEDAFRAAFGPAIDAVLALFGNAPAQKGTRARTRMAAGLAAEELALEVLAEESAAQATIQRRRVVDRALDEVKRDASSEEERAAVERLRASVHSRGGARPSFNFNR